MSAALTYDSMGRVASAVNANGDKTAYEYGNAQFPYLLTKTTVFDPQRQYGLFGGDGITEFGYDQYGLYNTSQTVYYGDGQSATKQFRYNYTHNALMEKTMPDGGKYQYAYDTLGRVIQAREPYTQGDGSRWQRVTQYTYAPLSVIRNDTTFGESLVYYRQSTTVYAGAENSTVGQYIFESADYYNSFGTKSISRLKNQKDGSFTKTYYWYDTVGRNVKTRDNRGSEYQYAYDAWDHNTSITDPNGSQYITEYDMANRTRLSYFRPVSSPASQENHRRETYDPWGNLTAVSAYPNGYGSAPLTYAYTYDISGNVLTATDPDGYTTANEYDPLGRRVKTTYPDGTADTVIYNAFNTPNYTKSLDETGKQVFSLVNVADERGATRLDGRTVGNRLTEINAHETDLMGRTAAYHRQGKEYGYQFDLSGNITHWQAGSSTISATYGKFGINGYTLSSLEEIAFDYDPNGYLAKKEHGGFVMQYAFDELGRVTHYGSPSGDIAQYQYNALHQVASIVMDGKTYTYQYYDDGQVKSVTYPNGMVQQYAYDNLNRTKSIQVTLDNTTLSEIFYTYDGRGNISTEMADNVQTAYTYDGRNRLKTVTKGGVTTTYAYDANNNRLSDTTLGGSVTEYAYDDDGRLVTVTKNGQVTDTYSYNALGAMTAHNGDVFTYNEWDKLVQFTPETGTPTTYAYDAEGIRVAKNTVHYANDLNKNVAADSNDSQMLWGRGPIAREVNGQWYYYITNAHGDVLALVDDSGTVRNTYQYDAWGNTTQKHETVDNPFRYNGQFTDDETGLIYLRSRYYDPRTGRFTSEDGARDGMNWYAYCGNNPVNFADPSGKFGENTKLSYNQSYTPDVVKLQRRLVLLGYLDMSDNKGWGYFGPKTQAAVNNYKEKNNLWNFGSYWGVVGKTTWEHMGLRVDNGYETGGYTGTPEAYGRGTFFLANGPTIENGLQLGDVETGIAKIGGDYKFGRWEVDAVNADAALGFTADYFGAQAGARLIAAEGGFKVPIPFTDKSIFIGAEGELFGIGFRAYYKDGKLKIGATAIAGSNVILGIE